MLTLHRGWHTNMAGLCFSCLFIYVVTILCSHKAAVQVECCRWLPAITGLAVELLCLILIRPQGTAKSPSNRQWMCSW